MYLHRGCERDILEVDEKSKFHEKNKQIKKYHVKKCSLYENHYLLELTGVNCYH